MGMSICVVPTYVREIGYLAQQVFVRTLEGFLGGVETLFSTVHAFLDDILLEPSSHRDRGRSGLVASPLLGPGQEQVEPLRLLKGRNNHGLGTG